MIFGLAGAYAIYGGFRSVANTDIVRVTVPASAVVDHSSSAEMEAFLRTVPWWRSFGLWSTLLIACVIGLYIRFF